jgi:hypothetical protein
MKPYGLSIKQYINDSKKDGDLFGLRGIHNQGSFAKKKNGLRHYKKMARRTARLEMVMEVED